MQTESYRWLAGGSIWEVMSSAGVRRPTAGEALGVGDLLGGHKVGTDVATLDRCLAVFTRRQPRRGQVAHL